MVKTTKELVTIVIINRNQIAVGRAVKLYDKNVCLGKLLQ